MRYQILDMDMIRSGECRVPNPDGNLGLNIDLALLSEEETLSKFKECFDAGVDYGDGIRRNRKTPNWDDIKNIL